MISQKLLLASVISIAFIAEASAQTGTRPAGPPPPTNAAIETRLSALEKQNTQLVAQVATLQQQATQNKADNDKALFDVRFRVTALEATNKVGTTTSLSSLQTQVTNLTTGLSTANKTLSTVSGGLEATNGKLAALTTQFQNHTHTYDKTTFGIDAGKITQLKMATPTSTSPPK